MRDAFVAHAVFDSRRMADRDALLFLASIPAHIFCSPAQCFSSCTGGFCVSHGGGKRCQAQDCAKGAQAGGVFCKSHGGGRRCRIEGCMTRYRWEMWVRSGGLSSLGGVPESFTKNVVCRLILHVLALGLGFDSLCRRHCQSRPSAIRPVVMMLPFVRV